MLIQMFTFCRKILLDPIGYAVLYLKQERATPRMRTYAMYVFFISGIVRGALQPTYKFLSAYPFFSQDILIGLWPHIVLLSCFLVSVIGLLVLFLYANLYISYVFSRWIFTHALEQAGASTSIGRLHDLNVYLLAHAQLLGMFPSFVTLLSLLVQGDGMVRPFRLMILLLGMVVFVRDLYVRYYAIQRVTDASPVKAFLWSLGISMALSFVLAQVLSLLRSQLAGILAY